MTVGTRCPTRSALIVVALGVACEVALARGYEQPLEELFQTETVYPQEAGETQVTMASVTRRTHDATFVELPIRVEYGLTDAWQLEVEWTAFARNGGESPATGVGDLEVGTKYSLMDESECGFHQAFGLDVQIPSGKREIGEGVVEYVPYVVLAKDVRPTVQLFMQAGLEIVQHVRAVDDDDDDDDDDDEHRFFMNVGAFAAIGEWVAVGEIDWGSDLRQPGCHNEVYFTPGAVRSVGDLVEVGIGLPIGLTEGADRVRVIAQATIEF